jgi:hypothetical protein
MRNKNGKVEENRATITFKIDSGILHPDPNHLGSRIWYMGGKIVTYNLHHIIITVKESKITEMIDYVEEYLTERKVEYGTIGVI